MKNLREINKIMLANTNWWKFTSEEKREQITKQLLSLFKKQMKGIIGKMEISFIKQGEDTEYTLKKTDERIRNALREKLLKNIEGLT